MKILMISPSSGGIDVYVNRLSAILRKHKIKVDINGSTEDESAFDEVKKKWLTSKNVQRIVSRIAKDVVDSSYLVRPGARNGKRQTADPHDQYF